MSGKSKKIYRYQYLRRLVTRIRDDLNHHDYVLLFAHNGIGKTRLSMAFKDAGKQDDKRDTLYFNAFTEDLFSWDNDFKGDSERMLKLNTESRFFTGLEDFEMETRIRLILNRYADFAFRIDYAETIDDIPDFDAVPSINSIDKGWRVIFSRGDKRNIKVSRGEENIFIWCFFLAIVQLAMDKNIEAYQWVRYIYIDDPISSLDDNNAIAVACHLAQLLRQDSDIKAVLSSHHTLFFNVMYNELKNTRKMKSWFLDREQASGEYTLRHTGDTPFFHHVVLLKKLKAAADSGELRTSHFNILRNIPEKTASFHGFKKFSDCLSQDDNNDPDRVAYSRIINLLNHGNYSLFEPVEMVEDNKGLFKKILDEFMKKYYFNPELFLPLSEAESS